MSGFFLRPFSLFLAAFEPFWSQNRAKVLPKWAIFRSFWGDFGPFLGCFGVTLGLISHRFGIISGSFCGRFDLILRSFGPFWPILGNFRVFLGLFGGVFYGLLVDFWWCIETSNRKMSKVRQYNAKNMQLSAKIDKKMGKIMQKQDFLSL